MSSRSEMPKIVCTGLELTSASENRICNTDGALLIIRYSQFSDCPKILKKRRQNLCDSRLQRALLDGGVYI